MASGYKYKPESARQMAARTLRAQQTELMVGWESHCAGAPGFPLARLAGNQPPGAG